MDLEEKVVVWEDIQV